MKKRLVSVALVAALAAGTLAGCGSSSSGDNTQAAAGGETAGKGGSSDENITLRFAWWGGDERNEATLKVIEQFEAAHPNITIEAEYGGSDGYHDKLATQLASGTAADIVQVDPEVFPTYVSTGDYFIDYKDYDMDLSNFDENYISLEINGRYDGKQLGLPTGISGSGMLVNKDLADAIGIDFSQPYTWSDLIDMGKKVREYDDSMYLLCANKEYLVNMVVFNYGKQLLGKTFFDADTKTLNLTEDDLKTVYEYVKQLYDEEVVAPASYQASYTGDNLQSDTNWIAGKYVAAPTYISTIDVMVAANPEATVEFAYVGSYEDPAKAKEIASAMISQGCDVLQTDSGASNAGVVEACKDAGILCAGEITDYYDVYEGFYGIEGIGFGDTAYKAVEMLINDNFEGGTHGIRDLTNGGYFMDWDAFNRFADANEEYSEVMKAAIADAQKLEEQIKEMFFGGEISFNDEVYITNARHKAALEEADKSLDLVRNSIEMGMPEDFFSIDLMNAYENLGKILGESVGEDLVNEIFSKFCMGK